MAFVKSTMLGQLLTLAVVPALGALGLDSPAARNLVLGTAAQETGGRLIAQIGGPALGFWQMEPATAAWVVQTVVARFPILHAAMVTLSIPNRSLEEQLATNLLYGAAMCRLRYYLVPAPLPAATDLPGLGAYWKAYYNTAAGAGDAAEFCANYAALIGAPTDPPGIGA